MTTQNITVTIPDQEYSVTNTSEVALTVVLPSYSVVATEGQCGQVTSQVSPYQFEISTENAPQITVSLPAYSVDVTVIQGASVGGSDNNLVIKEVSGTINGSNTGFTIPATFSGKSFILLGQTFLVEDVHYTVSGTDIAYLSAPPAGLSGKTHYLYHG